MVLPRLAWLEQMWTDVSFGVRSQLKTPVVSIAIVATLALGVAAASVAFSLLNGFFLRPLPVHEPERLVRIFTSYAAGLQYFTVSYPDYLDMRELTHVFSGALAEEPAPVTIAVPGSFERIWGEVVSSGYFPLLGVRPAHGRFFTTEEDTTTGGHPVVVLSHGLWKRAFGGQRDAVGRTLVLNGRPFTIVGVTPAEFHGMTLGLVSELWLPAVQEKEFRRGDSLHSRAGRGYFVIGRLRPGVSIEEARASLDRLADHLQREFFGSNRGVRFTVIAESAGRVNPVVRAGVLGSTSVLMAVALLMLLVACANVAGVLLVRASARRTEIGVRLALGATRGRIVRQLLTEGALLSFVAGGIGVLLAWATTGILSAIRVTIARGAPVTVDFGLDVRVLAFSFVVTALTGMAFGLAPALDASQTDLVTALKNGDIRRGLRPSRLRSALVVAQVAVSMLLLVGGGLLLRSLENAHRTDLGFDPRGVVTMSADPGFADGSPRASAQFWPRLIDAIGRIPGTESVSLATRLPLDLGIVAGRIAPEGYQPPVAGGWPVVDFAGVGPSFFHTLRIPLLEGREFRDTDVSGEVVIVNDVLARQFWPGAVAVGKRVTIGARRTAEVIGVARSTKYLSIGEAPKPYVYEPLQAGDARSATVVVRSTGDAAAHLRAVREAVRAIDPGVPLYNVTTMADRLAVALAPAAAGATVLAVVAAMALALTAFGLYGTIAQTVSHRTYEIGVRRALGAADADVVRLVVGAALTCVSIGLASGFALGWGASRLVRSLLYGVAAVGPVVFGVAAIVLVIVCVIASAIPSWRAVRINAATALRYE